MIPHTTFGSPFEPDLAGLCTFVVVRLFSLITFERFWERNLSAGRADRADDSRVVVYPALSRSGRPPSNIAIKKQGFEKARPFYSYKTGLSFLNSCFWNLSKPFLRILTSTTNSWLSDEILAALMSLNICDKLIKMINFLNHSWSTYVEYEGYLNSFLCGQK